MSDSSAPPPSSKTAAVSEDILNVIQSGQVKTSSTSNKLSLLMDSSSDEEEIVNKKGRKSPLKKKIDSEDENGFLSDGFDADFYGDSEDRARLLGMTEVEREAILYERAQARQARQERRALEQRIREREEMASGGKRAPSKEIDLKRKKLNELKAKRQKKLLKDDDEEEEGEFESSESEEESEIEKQKISSKKKKSRKSRKDSDDDYYTEDEDDVSAGTKSAKKSGISVSKKSNISVDSDTEEDGDELDLDMANKLRLSRDILAQWVYRDGFEEICQKCLLRINLGAGRNGEPTYRVVELKKIVPHHRSYLIKPGTPTNLATLVKFAKNERIFSFEFVSNSPFSQGELDYWKSECKKANVRLPYNNASARRKIEKLKAFHTEPLSDAVISSMLERRKELTTAQNAPRNLLAEQTILQQQLKEALERSNADEEVARIEAELAAIQAKRQMSDSRDRLAGMEDLNRRNRLVNLETGRQAEITRMQSEQAPAIDNANADKVKKAPTLDPFQRRKCKPTIIHMNETETVEEVAEVVKEAETGSVESETNDQITNATTTQIAQTTNLFDAHNFDLDLDI